MDMTLDEFRRQLQSPDRPTRAYFVGKLMRQGKPDDLFTFVPLATVCELWADVQPYLGRTREFWHWWMGLQETVVVDLVAEPVAAGWPPQTAATDGGTIQVDTAQEILANKHGALLLRAELRDLVDVRALLALGCDLSEGLRAAATKDLGFSPLLVGHLLHQFPVERQATANGLDAAAAAELAAFARDLATRIAAAARP